MLSDICRFKIHNQLAMKNIHLVFIPVITSSHLTSPIEFAKRLLDQNERLCITFLAILLPNQTDLDPGIKSFAASNPRFRVIIVPNTTNSLPQPSSSISIEKLATLYIDSHKSQVEKAITKLLLDDSIQLAGFVLDLFCSSMIDVANKFNIPAYIFFTSNIAFLGFLLHLPTRHNEVAVEFQLSDADSVVPSYQIPVPAYALPNAVFDKSGGGYEYFLYHGTKFKEAKGIIVNSFVELEPYAFDSVVAPPTVYPVGPLIDHKNTNNSTNWIEIRNWLDNQLPKSVIFLCFGTHGSFNESQLEQMANALERSGHQFLWSIRKPPPKGTNGPPSDYTNVEEVLPNGFLERVKRKGMVCGWAPQVDVLAHEAVKGFVSHCGWNSILESLWYGVPIATWPMHAEQHLNAFWLVKELGLAVELSLTYRNTNSELVMADQIEKAINCLMDNENPVHERVKEMSEISRKALIKGGSSVVTLGKLVADMLQNITGK